MPETDEMNVHGTRCGTGRGDEAPKTKWDAAENIPMKRIRQYLCSEGRQNSKNCVKCESQCKFGERLLQAIRDGEIDHHRSGGRWTRPREAYDPEMNERACEEVKRVYASMGMKMPDWQEALMEQEAEEWHRRHGPPRTDEFDAVDAEIVSAVLQADGFHNFAEFGGDEGRGKRA